MADEQDQMSSCEVRDSARDSLVVRLPAGMRRCEHTDSGTSDWVLLSRRTNVVLTAYDAGAGEGMRPARIRPLLRLSHVWLQIQVYFDLNSRVPPITSASVLLPSFNTVLRPHHTSTFRERRRHTHAHHTPLQQQRPPLVWSSHARPCALRQPLSA